MKISGIYKITNIVSNKFYIGSAVNIVARWSSHRCNLNKNKHTNKYLQSAWNKYGKENFIIEVVEEVESKLNLIDREQFWIDTLKPQYNLAITAGSRLGTFHSEETKMKFRNKIISKETREKMSAAKIGRILPEETKRKMSLASIGKKKSKEHVSNISLGLKGYKHSEISKQNIAKAKIGRITSDATKLKLSIIGKSRQRDDVRNFEKWPCAGGVKCVCEDCKKKKRKYYRNYMRKRRNSSLISEENAIGY